MKSNFQNIRAFISKMNLITQSTKLTIQVILATLLVLAGLTLLFMGFQTPPPGEIHDSILIAYGEVSTFAGSLLGVDYHYRYKEFKIREERKEEKHEETD